RSLSAFSQGAWSVRVPGPRRVGNLSPRPMKKLAHANTVDVRHVELQDVSNDEDEVPNIVRVRSSTALRPRTLQLEESEVNRIKKLPSLMKKIDEPPPLKPRKRPK
ncbi:unnamed protein product, partial [Effrenium voratum]